MSDAQEKTEEASQHKLDESRKKGMVPHSADLMSLAVLAAFLLALAATGAGVARTLAVHSRWWLENAALLAVSPGQMLGAGGFSLQAVLYALLPMVAAIVLLAILMNLLFSGFVFSTQPLKPDFKRLHPKQGLKKIFSRRMLIELAKVLVKGLLFAAVLYLLAQQLVHQLLAQPLGAAMALPAQFSVLLVRVGVAALAVMAVAAALDMWLSRKEFARQMRMSRHETKEEHKHREGDPEIKARRRSAQQSLLQKLVALAKVKDADVILTNPTHVAVALQFRSKHMAVPVVLSLGKGMLAAQICRLARRHRVPILQRPPLARALYRHGGLNHPIPLQTENEVVDVYRWVVAQPGNKVMA